MHTPNLSLRALWITFAIALHIHYVEGLPIHPPDVRTQLMCGPADWEDIFIFFLLNYATHVATVKSFPGNKFNVTIQWAIAALLVPYSGIVRGCAAIASSRLFSGDTQLQQAARAGALCTVRRTAEWKPTVGSVINGCKISVSNSSQWAILSVKVTPAEDIDPKSVTVHGHVPSTLPPGFILSKLPKDVAVSHQNIHQSDHAQLARSIVPLKSLVGILQLMFAVVTLYRTRGKQKSLFGYAAYGLTVIPYAVMSLINLVAHCFNPDYPAIFITGSKVLRECQSRGAYCDGVIGQIEEDAEGTQKIIIRDIKSFTNLEQHGFLVRYDIIPDLDPTHTSIGSASERGSLETADSVISDDSDRTLRTDASNTEESSKGLSASSQKSKSKISSSTALIQAALCNKIEVPDFGPLKRQKPSTWLRVTSYLIGTIGLVAPYAIIALLTGFEGGEMATSTQKSWTMSWLVFGQVFGFLIGGAMQKHEARGTKATAALILLIVLAGIPAIAGLVIVGQMLVRSGDCQLGPGSDIFAHGTSELEQ